MKINKKQADKIKDLFNGKNGFCNRETLFDLFNILEINFKLNNFSNQLIDIDIQENKKIKHLLDDMLDSSKALFYDSSDYDTESYALSLIKNIEELAKELEVKI